MSETVRTDLRVPDKIREKIQTVGPATEIARRP